MFRQYTFSIKDIPFSRYGSFITLFDNGTEGDSSIMIASTHSVLNALNPFTGKPRNQLLRIGLCHEGKEEPYSAVADPVSVHLTGAHGSAEMLITDDECVRIRSRGVSVYIDAPMAMHEIAKNRNDGSWELCFIPSWKLMIYPVRGTMEANADLNWLETKTENVHFRIDPDDGCSDVAIHLYETNLLTPERYAPFDDLRGRNEASLEKWMAIIPPIPPEYDRERMLTGYCIWSNMMLPYGHIQAPTMFCSKTMFSLGMTWHQSYAAMALYRDPQLSWTLLKTMFYHQDIYGMLPDWIKDNERTYMATKPPIQGWALLWVMDHADLSALPASEFIWMYERMSKWYGWWMSFRDTDNDGVAQYDTGDESGWDDATVFSQGIPVESPDLCSYLILMAEATSRLARRIGRKLEAEEWMEKSRRMLATLIDFFWDGERFTTRKSMTHEPVPCLSAVSYQPLILGRRLPDDIIRKMADDLSVEGDYLTPYGFASERLDSPLFRPYSWMAGSINSALNFQLCTGLWDCGQVDLAREVARRFTQNGIREYWPFSYDAHTGKRLNRPSSQQPLTAWMCVFFLAMEDHFLMR